MPVEDAGAITTAKTTADVKDPTAEACRKPLRLCQRGTSKLSAAPRPNKIAESTVKYHSGSLGSVPCANWHPFDKLPPQPACAPSKAHVATFVKGAAVMTLTPVVTPVLSVSLSVQAVLAFIQAIVPYKPRPEKIANYFAAIGSAIPALATIWGLPLYPAAWNVSWTVVAIVMTALAVTPPLVGLIEAKCRKKSQIFETNRFAGHLATNLGGAVAATVLVWMGHSVNGFGTFTNNFTDKAALNCVLPMTILANFAFVRWQQVNECPDLDGRIKRGEEWEPALTGFSLKHAHQLANLVFLIAVTFSATTTLLYLFAFAVKQAKSSHPLQFSWQIGVAMGLSLIFFYACGLKWSRQHRAVYLTFLTGTPAALGAVLVWLALLDHGTARNVVAFSIAIGGYLLYAVEAVLASRDSGEKLELYYFATTIFALVLMLMVGALYIFK